MREPSEKERAAFGEGIKFGENMLRQIPKGDRLALEAHITGVLILFWGALWGTFGKDYAKDFIEAQLRSMEHGVETETYTEPTIQ